MVKWRVLIVEEPVGGPEQAVAVAEHHGVDGDPVLVDQLAPGQLLENPGSPWATIGASSSAPPSAFSSARASRPSRR